MPSTAMWRGLDLGAARIGPCDSLAGARAGRCSDSPAPCSSLPATGPLCPRFSVAPAAGGFGAFVKVGER
jgi:hypothetical protein